MNPYQPIVMDNIMAELDSWESIVLTRDRSLLGEGPSVDASRLALP